MSMQKGNQQNPFENLKNLGDLKDIKKLLGADFFRSFALPGMGSDDMFNDNPEQTYPLVDMYDLGDEISVFAEIPGLKRSDLSLAVSSYNLVLRGNVPSPSGKRNHRIVLSERFSGGFERNIELPTRVRTESVEATYTSGLLIVILKKFSPEEGEINHVVDIQFDS